MCRFVAYKGNEILMADLLTRTPHSLITQSFQSKERAEPLNGDGFGVGWYIEEDPIPCFFTSLTPAWSNNNLHRLSEKIRSSCFFAHVRAATSGLLVSEANCHPFQYEKFLWMHNGLIGPFNKIKRQMRSVLSDELYDVVQGSTDSEHTFGLFLNMLGEELHNPSLETQRETMKKTVLQIFEWSRNADGEEPSYLNFALTDGENLVVSRCVSHDHVEPPSLYISCGSSFELHEGDFRMKRDQRGPQTVIISSEPLTVFKEDWVEVPKNHIVTVSKDTRVEMTPIY